MREMLLLREEFSCWRYGGTKMLEQAMLSGLRVLDLGGSKASAIATMVLADAGADVVMVEPNSGDSVRSEHGFITWGRNKRSIRIDVMSASGRDELDKLLSRVDILVHSLNPTIAKSLRLDDASLSAHHPHLIVSSILGWPINHDQADAPIDDHIVLARLGVLDEQLGRREGPIYVRFPLGTWSAAWLAVIGIMARVVSRDRGGVVGPAHTSLAQGALVPMMMHWSRAETPSQMLAVGMPKDRMRASLFECADGRWVHVMPPAPDNTPLMQEVFAEMGPALMAEANERHNASGVPGWVNWGALIEAFKRRGSNSWLENMWGNDIPAQPAVALGEILDDEQALDNDYVLDVAVQGLGRVRTAGLPITLDPAASVRTMPPELGEHDAELRATWLAAPVKKIDMSRARRLRHPLEGLKVVDFGNFLAGPLGPMLLADLGATVVKVEAHTGDPMRFADWPFAGCQRGKRAVALDIKSPDAKPALEAILKWADVVHHNLRLPAARRLGLDGDAVRAVNPEVIFCHVSSYGPKGKRADWPGYDQLFQSSCGWEVAGAGQDNPPMWHRFGFMDHLCAMASAAGTLMALHHQHQTGCATNVAASLLGTGVLTNSETYVTSDGTLASVPILDSEQMMISPGRRLLKMADGWLAMSATCDEQVDAFCQMTGTSDADAAAAEMNTLTAADGLSRLQALGIPAESVRRGQQGPFFDDPSHLAAGLVASYDHRDWGRLEQPGAMWCLGEQSTRLELAPPVLGEHTVEVLLEVGLGQNEVDALIASGVAVAR